MGWEGGVRDKARCNRLGWGSKGQSKVQWAGRGEVRDKARCNGLGEGK